MLTQSLFFPSGISTLPIVAVLHTNPIQLNKRLAQVRVQNCIWPSSCSGYLLTKVSATSIATAELTNVNSSRY